MPRLAAALLLLVASSAAPAQSSHARGRTFRVPGGSITLSQRGSTTIVRLTTRAGTRLARLPKDELISPRSLYSGQLLGVPSAKVFILETTYGSSPTNPMHQCGAGEETYVRVISFTGTPHQTFEQLVESCWATIEPGGSGFDAKTGLLTIERTVYDPTTAHTRTSYRISLDGSVTQGKVEQLPD